MRAFRQKWQDVLRWEIDDRGGEYFDPSFVQVKNFDPKPKAYFVDVHKPTAEANTGLFF